MSVIEGKCICQFCICGRHRCPQDRGSLGRDQTKPVSPTPTEYQLAYEEHPYQPRRPNLRPMGQDQGPRVPMDITSTYTDAFLQHDSTSPRTPFRPRYVPVRTDVPFDINSIYRRDYTKKNGKRLDSYKPESNYVRSTAKVDQDTMYRVTFKEHGKEDWAWCRAAPIRHKECIENFGSGATKIESTSVMKNDFRHHEHPDRAHLHRPQPENSVEGGAFHSDTSYKTDFKQKQITPVQAIRPTEYKAPTARFEGTTTVKSDYTPHPGHRREPAFRPPVNHHPSKVQFEGSTTTSEAYREWPAQQMEKPSWAKQKAYEPTAVSNVYHSSYQSDFVQPEKFERVKPLKPTPQDKDILHGPSDSDIPQVTHYMEKFVPFKKTNPAKSFKMHQVYETPREKFTGESVYQANYTGERASPAQSIAPNKRRNSDETPRSIDFHTTYKGTYKAERPASCPAKELMSASEEFGHIGFRNGHQYYVQRSPRRCKTPSYMDPIFPSKPESQKTDRERSSSRPSSARKSPRSPSKTDQRATTRSPRSTTPRQPSTRPRSAQKTPQTSPRTQETKTSPRANVNNSNSGTKGAKTGDTAVKSVPKKAIAKTGNENNSNSNAAKSSPKHSVSKTAAKKDAGKPEPNKNNSNSNIPPPIRAPKKVDQAPAAAKVAPVAQTTKSTTQEPKAVPHSSVPKAPSGTTPTTTATTKPVSTAATTKPTGSNAVPRPVSKMPVTATTTAVSAPVPIKPSGPVSSSAPEPPASFTPSTVSHARMPAAVSVSPAVTSAFSGAVTAPVAVKPSPAPSALPTAPVTAPVLVPSKATPAAAAPTSGAFKPVIPSSNSVPTTNDFSTTPPKPATTTAPNTEKPLSTAPVMAPAPVLPPTTMAAPPVDLLDLSALEDKLLSGKTPATTKAPDSGISGEPQMPVIAPPPAPAQPVVLTGGMQHEANLLQ